VLLLDDIFDKLDHSRVERLMHMVADNFFGQVLVTDTDAERVQKIFAESNLNYNIYEVEAGSVKQLENVEAE